MKVRFNIKGPHTGAIVFAEVSDKLDAKNGEWVYLIVQVTVSPESPNLNLTLLCPSA